jgi:hypothetical protein
MLSCRFLRPGRLAVATISCVLALAGAAASASGAIPVNLRVEGSTRTLFEGTAPSEPLPLPGGIATTSSEGAHPCDVKDNGSNGGFGPSASTPTAALYEAATAQGLAFDATWSATFNDFLVTQVGGDVNGGAPEFASWGYAVSFTTAGVGGCQFQLAPGSSVLWAYNYFNLPHLLSLTGPVAAEAGSPFTVHVADGQTGEPLAGASIGEVSGGVTTPIASTAPTDARGDVTIVIARPGVVTLKATRSDAVRSNGLVVCVHTAGDGTCGTSVASPGAVPGPAATRAGSAPQAALFARILGVRAGRTYPRRRAPRVLRGVVHLSGGAVLREVRMRLQRRHRGRCFSFSGARERFLRSRSCAAAPFFSVGSAQSFSYLLPGRLPGGRYTFDIQAIDGRGQASRLVGGVSHVVFRVR